MTENEAINAIRLQGGIEITGRAKRVAEFFEGLDIAVKALEEVREYRKLGTVEECREAVEKAKAKKCVQDTCHDHTHYKCPTCGKIQMSVYTHGCHRLGRIPNNCDNCGQKLEGEE